ncbi:MAG: hypothetical protein K2X90_00735 [Candidatus Babeliaceae bacterium]|nr:hypothetical protein [Candidatus Babeliaceae bacterium]
MIMSILPLLFLCISLHSADSCSQAAPPSYEQDALLPVGAPDFFDHQEKNKLTRALEDPNPLNSLINLANSYNSKGNCYDLIHRLGILALASAYENTGEASSEIVKVLTEIKKSFWSTPKHYNTIIESFEEHILALKQDSLRASDKSLNTATLFCNYPYNRLDTKPRLDRSAEDYSKIIKNEKNYHPNDLFKYGYDLLQGVGGRSAQPVRGIGIAVLLARKHYDCYYGHKLLTLIALAKRGFIGDPIISPNYVYAHKCAKKYYDLIRKNNELSREDIAFRKKDSLDWLLESSRKVGDAETAIKLCIEGINQEDSSEYEVDRYLAIKKEIEGYR